MLNMFSTNFVENVQLPWAKENFSESTSVKENEQNYATLYTFQQKTPLYIFHNDIALMTSKSRDIKQEAKLSLG